MAQETQKIALVTGGSRGLGKDMAMSLSGKGISVLITYNSKKDEAEAVVAAAQANGVKAAALQFDAGKISGYDGFITSVKKTLHDVFGVERFDFLINNAGVALYSPFAETTEEQFDTIMDIHYKGVFFLTQKSLPILNDGGRIVNISSGLARFSQPGSSAYGSAKAAVESLTRYMAKELGERSISVNVVAPGPIATDFGGGRVRDNADINGHLSALTALGRVGRPDDIGGVVAFLCSDDAKWINAQRIEVAGGIFI
ncbi:MAG: SDR family oxidoreductase [Chitinophagaceae bacterium]|nr:MAG: SDR family oxidoreductase [Chitinophagaceae bacterium]